MASYVLGCPLHERRQPGGVAQTDHEHPGGHRIQRSGVTDAALAVERRSRPTTSWLVQPCGLSISAKPEITGAGRLVAPAECRGCAVAGFDPSNQQRCNTRPKEAN